jgi:hypothetical protein
MPSFQDILDTPMDEIKPPQPLPPGPYIALINGHPEIAQRGRNNNHCVIVSTKLVQALDTSPGFQQQLVEALNGKPLSDIQLKHTFWLTDDSKYRLANFLTDYLGVPKGKSISEGIAQIDGKQIIANVGHYTSEKEGEAPRVGMEIKSFAKA